MKSVKAIALSAVFLAAAAANSAYSEEIEVSACTAEGNLAYITFIMESPPPEAPSVMQAAWESTVKGFNRDEIMSESGFARFATNYRAMADKLGGLIFYSNAKVSAKTLPQCALST